jgi:hypothetical protein
MGELKPFTSNAGIFPIIAKAPGTGRRTFVLFNQTGATKNF